MDIQNTSTLTDEKLKIKFSSLKLTLPPDEFVSFDTRPKDFIVVSDDLTTANMDPCWPLVRAWLVEGFALVCEKEVASCSVFKLRELCKMHDNLMLLYM